ncbi:hypothetical protein DOJK_00075 [Patescibacteria group bacterium]|nr:hypothetical protein DOJK_00075 [Patescibacteria group bacterium]
MKNFSEKIREELLAVKEQSYKTRFQKRVFIIALLGLGSIEPFNLGISKTLDIAGGDSFKIQFYQVLYLAPFVAIIFDMIIAEHGFSIRRMGKFLRIPSPFSGEDEKREKEWENFVSKHRDNSFRHAELLFTLLTFLSSLYILITIQKSLSLPEILWFVFLAVFCAIFNFYAHFKFKELDKKVQYTYWKKDDHTFAGYINDYPDHVKEGQTKEEVHQLLLILLKGIEEDRIPNVKKVDELDEL